MKVVLQRVKSAYVKVDSSIISEINHGYLHLWAGEEYYLDKQLDKKEIGKKTKLQSA